MLLSHALLRVRSASFGRALHTCLGLAAGAAALLPVAGLRAQSAGTYTWVTIGGTTGVGTSGTADGFGTTARFSGASDIAIDSAGNAYVTDTTNHTIRKISPRGVVTTFAGLARTPGTADGELAVARFENPRGLAIRNDEIYVADAGNHTIRKVGRDGRVTTLFGLAKAPGNVDGNGASVRFREPRGLTLDADGNLFVVDYGNRSIRKIIPTGTVTTLASFTSVTQPFDVVADADGNVFVTDTNAFVVRRISPAGVVSVFAGGALSGSSVDGPGTAAMLGRPQGIAIDSAGMLYLADSDYGMIRRITPVAQVTTIGGHLPQPIPSEDGVGTNAAFYLPRGIDVDASGNIYVVESGNGDRVRFGTTQPTPRIFSEEKERAVTQEGSLLLSVITVGNPAPTLQWFRNNTPIAGANNSSLFLTNVTAAQEGVYSVEARNAAGTATASIGRVLVQAPLAIVAQPRAAMIKADGATTLSVTASGVGPITYEWSLDGVAIPGGTTSTILAATPGTYRVLVKNPTGAILSNSAVVSFSNRLVNLATRGMTGRGSDALVAGFVVKGSGTAPKQFLVRGVGPTLGAFGVPGVLPGTNVTVYSESGMVATNSGWTTAQNSEQVAAVAATVGAFPLAAGSADSALVVNLAPGAYTAEVAALSSIVGTSLVEVYEVGSDAKRLINLSTRGRVTAEDGFTAGMVLAGPEATKVLVRAVGPGLAQFGVPGTVARPVLVLYREGTVIATNSGWATASNAADIAAAGVQTGAFALPAGSADAALLLSLAPGAYTAIVKGADGSGLALLEIYEVP